MSRNGSGTYSVPNSFSANTTIESGKVNQNFSDVGAEITNSLARDGQSSMTGQFKAANGTSTAPGITFSADLNTGLYRKSADVMGLVAGGTEVATVETTGIKDTAGIVISGIPTGAMMMYGATTAPSGWLRLNGRTIGNASSGATERANADTENLFTFLWTHYADGVCAVSSGRGASAAADYAANKTIALPDLRGRAFFGLDDMGNSAAGRLGDVISNETTNGSSGGSETVTIARADLPNVTLGGTTNTTGAHTHSYDIPNSQGDNLAGNGAWNANLNGTRNTSSNGSHSHTITTDSINGGVTQTALENMPPAFLTTFIIKL